MTAISKRQGRGVRRATSAKDRVGAYRDRLRAKGLRPVQIWLPDHREPAFVKEARRQAKLAASSAQARDDQAFVDAISEFRTT